MNITTKINPNQFGFTPYIDPIPEILTPYKINLSEITSSAFQGLYHTFIKKPSTFIGNGFTASKNFFNNTVLKITTFAQPFLDAFISPLNFRCLGAHLGGFMTADAFIQLVKNDNQNVNFTNETMKFLTGIFLMTVSNQVESNSGVSTTLLIATLGGAFVASVRRAINDLAPQAKLKTQKITPIKQDKTQLEDLIDKNFEILTNPLLELNYLVEKEKLQQFCEMLKKAADQSMNKKEPNPVNEKESPLLIVPN